ncbi:NADH-quinone oxidoreductase subunit N [Flavisolibacter ginsenosidimutans]|uniref:NADH-quinone oxidoreductase subunit N n=1 Tax=Flavisolibacter ginsenosidimutans TaxID=661481 RepID=A0A5B8UJF8_9BACT|nr:NADH-quinone oxidoreductase subunit N [Flavisolibacter ginsenosidimutans]QEC56532.1 NADH-quinone oxidoreductase subunit N [Flavisolibacter ginsenosidimutans]
MNAIIFSAVSGVIMMFSGFGLKNSAVRSLALALLSLVIVSAVFELRGIAFFHINTGGMLSFDHFALLFTLIATVSTLVFFLLSARDMEKIGLNYSDYFALIFFVLSGVIISASFQSLLMLFLGIEIMSIPLYILTGSDKRSLKSNEASLKYFLMGSFSTGLMLMGIALIYGAAGTFSTVNIILPEGKVPVLFVTGLLFLLFALSFKVSAAPFHFWTPDVYDGAPTVITSFMATVVKAAGFIAFMRLFSDAFRTIGGEWKLIVAIVVAATLFIGNITAVFQQSVKRMLAYSSISQAGFMMLAVYTLTAEAKEGLLLYGAAYSLATIGIFAVLAKMKDYTFDGFNGFAKQQPLVAATLVIFLLSLAGIPLTAGFLSKFYMLSATVSVGNVWLAVFAVLMAAISVYYYFRLIQAMYFKDGTATLPSVSMGFKVTLVAVAAITVILGVYPNLLLYWLYF